MGRDYVADHQHLEEQITRLADALPGPMAACVDLHEQALLDGALGKKIKELIALGMGIAVRCDGCSAYHVHDALQAGATHHEVLEAIGIAIVMGGAPAVVYGTQALEALDQFEAELRSSSPAR